MSYNSNPVLIDEKVVAQAKQLGSALLADGMKGMGLEMDGCMEASIMPIGPHMSMAGTALTVETDQGDNFPIHVATYSGAEGYVMVIDGKGCAHTPYFGELVSGAAQAIGYNGMVCDGYVRDRESCIEQKFPIFAKGFLQRGPVKKGPGNINIPVRCGGITVNPGDLVVGDDDGITVVPRDRIAEVIKNAENKADYEAKRKETIQAYIEAKKEGKELPELAPKWVLDMLQK
ncbi:MAG: RraA family protein [Clostridiales bacterium]|nr:RraA family protein [Clostridiales bacterium]